VVTPARGLAIVALAATIALAGSQFVDYRGVEIGAPEYRGVDATPAPQIDRRSPRSAHGAWVLAIAGAAVVVIAFALARNWRLARLLIFLGAGVIAISLAVDAPRGLREGSAAVIYQGAEAVLLGGFWAQLASGVTLMVVGPVLALQLRAERDARHSRPRRSRRARRPRRARASSPAPGAGGAAT
jgi:hypothetical protein